MRLLYIATNFGSLTHTFIAREVSALRRLGVEVKLLALRPSRKAQAANPECDLNGCVFLYPVSVWRVVWSVAVVSVRRPGRWWRAVWAAVGSPRDRFPDRLKLLAQLAVATTVVRRVEVLDPDLMHAHLANPPGSYALFLSLLTGIPFSFTGHAADLYRRPLGNVQKLRHARGAVAISRYNERHYRSLVPDGPPVAVVHCGVRPAEFPYRHRERCSEPVRILAVGRAVPKKGFIDLLQALDWLEKETIPWQAQLVGGGPLLVGLQEQREFLGLHHLTITGPRQQVEIREMLAQSDVFVLPCVEAPDGDVDGIPVSLMEAMASGCPVISTRVSGIPELLDQGRAGMLVEPEDPAGIAAAITRLVREPELVSRLSEVGRMRVVEEFAIDTEAAKLKDFFAKLLESGEQN